MGINGFPQPLPALSVLARATVAAGRALPPPVAPAAAGDAEGPWGQGRRSETESLSLH